MITRIDMAKGDRMFTPVRLGHNDGRFFIRIDLWWVGYRWTR